MLSPVANQRAPYKQIVLTGLQIVKVKMSNRGNALLQAMLKKQFNLQMYVW